MATHASKKASKLTVRRAHAAVALVDTLPTLPPDCYSLTVVFHYYDDTSLTVEVDRVEADEPELPGLREWKRRLKA